MNTALNIVYLFISTDFFLSKKEKCQNMPVIVNAYLHNTPCTISKLLENDAWYGIVNNSMGLYAKYCYKIGVGTTSGSLRVH